MSNTVSPTKAGMALPEGELSPRNYVGDPNAGQFIDWNAQFMAKSGGVPIAQADTDGTPSEFMGRPTGYGLHPLAKAHVQSEPPTNMGNAYQQGITGEDPYTGSGGGGASERMVTVPDHVPAPAGVPPAMMSAGGITSNDKNPMPFAAQIFGMMQSKAPARVPSLPATPTSEPVAPVAKMEGPWINWEGSLLALAGMMGMTPQVGDSGAKPPPVPPPRKTKAKRLPCKPGDVATMGKMDASSVNGRGAGAKPFTYGEDDEGGDDSVGKSFRALDDLVKSLREIMPSRSEDPKHMVKQPQLGSKQPHKEPTMSRDLYGRPMSKGLYAFTSPDSATADLPKQYLYDYLCAFVEEAYEVESRERAHQDLNAKDRLVAMSRAIMNELVQAIPRNKNLMAAAKKYKVTADSIAAILVQKGIYKPASDAEYQGDFESWRAMGVMELSQKNPWIQNEPVPYGMGKALADRPVDNVAHLIKSDAVDPLELLAQHHTGQMNALWKGGAPIAKASPECPVHMGPDLHKAQNLYNPMLPCTCGGRPNPYG